MSITIDSRNSNKLNDPSFPSQYNRDKNTKTKIEEKIILKPITDKNEKQIRKNSNFIAKVQTRENLKNELKNNNTENNKFYEIANKFSQNLEYRKENQNNNSKIFIKDKQIKIMIGIMIIVLLI